MTHSDWDPEQLGYNSPNIMLSIIVLIEVG